MNKLVGLLILLTVFILSSCANLGDGEFNPKFSDTFLDGNIDIGDMHVAYTPYIKDAATILVLSKPSVAAKIVGFLVETKEEVNDFEKKYSSEDATSILKRQLLEKCGWQCNLTTVDNKINEVFSQMDTLEALNANDVAVPLVDYVDALLDAFYETQAEVNSAKGE